MRVLATVEARRKTGYSPTKWSAKSPTKKKVISPWRTFLVSENKFQKTNMHGKNKNLDWRIYLAQVALAHEHMMNCISILWTLQRTVCICFMYEQAMAYRELGHWVQGIRQSPWKAVRTQIYEWQLRKWENHWGHSANDRSPTLEIHVEAGTCQVERLNSPIWHKQRNSSCIKFGSTAHFNQGILSLITRE